MFLFLFLFQSDPLLDPIFIANFPFPLSCSLAAFELQVVFRESCCQNNGVESVDVRFRFILQHTCSSESCPASPRNTAPVLGSTWPAALHFAVNLVAIASAAVLYSVRQHHTNKRLTSNPFAGSTPTLHPIAGNKSYSITNCYQISGGWDTILLGIEAACCKFAATPSISTNFFRG